MGRQPGFHHLPETRKKIKKGVRLQQQKERDRIPSCFETKVETEKGIFYGVIEAESSEQAELRARTLFSRLGIPISKLEPRKRIPVGGGSTFYLPITGLPLCGQDIWVAVGRGEDFKRKTSRRKSIVKGGGNMATIEELKRLYQEAKYRELIELADRGDSDNEQLLLVGWARHQLGEYSESMAIFSGLAFAYSSSLQIGESARRGLAHGLLQTGGNFAEVEKIMAEISPSPDLDNVYINAALAKARKGEAISVEIVMGRIMAALGAVPYKTIHGHVINNGTLALYEARGQEGVKPYLPMLPGLILVAVGIYEATGAAKNHIAGAEFRASLICEAAGWKKNALLYAQTSRELWRELVDSEGGARFQKNLEGVQAQMNKLEQGLITD